MMKFRTLAATLAAATIISGAAIAEDLVLPSEVAATHWKTEYMDRFAKEVNAATNGEIDVKVFPAGQLYSDQAALGALGTGAVQMVWPVSVRLETIAPETGVINLPFAISDEMMQNACMKEGITNLLSKDMKSSGLRVLGLLRTADLYFIFSDREVASMGDLEGAKVRVTGGRVVQDTMNALGISPVSMAASEMSTALSQGAIDGVFTSPAGWAEMIGMTGKNAFYVPGFSILTYAIVVDDYWYQNLPAEQQNAISTAISDISTTQWTEAMEKDQEALEKMTSQGANLVVADDAEAAKWRELTASTSASFSDAYPQAVADLDALEAECGISG
ncbi:TRAP transporter substrate-binding protein DctP [Tropicimonas sp. IMCC34011]|uniref:TRAP transporter substrate-binding protein DctP n=1 Tax=Tropicimonas sp. IMCC34011 TaxID=2248759 RepID=UPI0018E4FD0E|nr:TRAP transporter substrate-binding protein DctP [Tropicimonas sp. IMCC34011]